MLICADIEYQTEDTVRRGTAVQMTLHFESDDEQAAITDVQRWWKNRNNAIPEHFAVLGAAKFFRFKPQRMDETGYLGPNTNFPYYEWKSTGFYGEFGSGYRPR